MKPLPEHVWLEVLRYGEDGGVRRLWQRAPWTTWVWNLINNAAVQGPKFTRRFHAKRWVERAVAMARHGAPSVEATRFALGLSVGSPFGIDVLTVDEQRREMGLPPYAQRQAARRVPPVVAPEVQFIDLPNTPQEALRRVDADRARRGLSPLDTDSFMERYGYGARGKTELDMQWPTPPKAPDIVFASLSPVRLPLREMQRYDLAPHAGGVRSGMTHGAALAALRTALIPSTSVAARIAEVMVDAAPAEEPELMWASSPCFPSVPPSAELRGLMHDWMVTTPAPIMLPPGTTLEIIPPTGDRTVTVNGVVLLPGESAAFTAVRVDPERPELGCTWELAEDDTNDLSPAEEQQVLDAATAEQRAASPPCEAPR